MFQSPLRLNLQLRCTPKTRARDTLDIWPPFPLIISDFPEILCDIPSRVDNIVAALEHNDRVCEIDLICLSSLQMKYVTNSAAMNRPFPELTSLFIHGSGSILPDSFLGGTTPRLRSINLDSISFPGLPKLLLSTAHLVRLHLRSIFGYIPPEAMAAGLSALTSLETLCLDFQHPQPRPSLESRPPLPPPLTPSVLPSLTDIRFKGTSEWLEAILGRIDAPRLNEDRKSVV